jgi:NTE family protein
MLFRPDILVLGAGGVLGGAWMAGVLAGIEDAAGLDLRECEYFVGTSAGAIQCALLAAGRRPERPPERHAPERAEELPETAAPALARRAGAWALALSSPLAPLALRAGAPGGALARAAALRVLPRPRERASGVREPIERSGARFDGRLRVAAVDRASGRRVMFGRPGAPRASVAAAVEASCAVPWLFAPVRVGSREYVDGGVWSPTNLDTAPAGRDTQVLCLAPLAAVGDPASSPGTLPALARGFTRSVIALEELALRRRGARVRTLIPDPASAVAIGHDLMARAPRAAVLRAGYRQGLGLAGGGPPALEQPCASLRMG